jgi:hypothetical protein
MLMGLAGTPVNVIACQAFRSTLNGSPSRGRI